MAKQKINNTQSNISLIGSSVTVNKTATQGIAATTQTKVYFEGTVAGSDPTILARDTSSGTGVKVVSSKVKSVRCTFYIQKNATTTGVLYVFRNTTQIAATSHPPVDSAFLSDIVVPVSQNDIIYFFVWFPSGLSLTASPDWNNATVSVQEVKD